MYNNEEINNNNSNPNIFKEQNNFMNNEIINPNKNQEKGMILEEA